MTVAAVRCVLGSSMKTVTNWHPVILTKAWSATLELIPWRTGGSVGVRDIVQWRGEWEVLREIKAFVVSLEQVRD